ERHTHHLGVVSTEAEQFSPAGGIPDPHRLVSRTADDAPPIGRERHTPHPGLVPAEAQQFGPTVGIPDPYRPPTTHCPTTLDPVGGAVGIPAPPRLVSRTADDSRPIGGERHAQHMALRPVPRPQVAHFGPTAVMPDALPV